MQRRTKSVYTGQARAEERQRKRIRRLIVLAVLVLLIAGAVLLLNRNTGTTQITVTPLTCTASQDVTPFGENVLYYDDVSIHCLAPNGAIKWSFAVGSNASFSVSKTHVIAWQGTQLYIIDENGNPTYNESLADTVQFARIGNKYAAVVIGDDTAPDLLVKDLQGSQTDEETEAFEGLMLLNVGFYGENDDYMWTLALDVYGTAINTILNTFQVGKMNTGEVSLGENLAYSVLFENSRLRVFTTQQMYTYDYKAVQDTNATMLVYGWKLVDSFIPDRGDANLLLAPTSQTSSSTAISELRVLSGSSDKRYSLPATCVGAHVTQNYLYGFATNNYMYRTAVNAQQFYGYAIPLPEGAQISSYLGCTTGNVALLASGETVYAVTLPE